MAEEAACDPADADVDWPNATSPEDRRRDILSTLSTSTGLRGLPGHMSPATWIAAVAAFTAKADSS